MGQAILQFFVLAQQNIEFLYVAILQTQNGVDVQSISKPLYMLQDACCVLQMLDLFTDADLPFHYWQLSASPFQFLTSVTLDLEHKEQKLSSYAPFHHYGSVGEATLNYE